MQTIAFSQQSSNYATSWWESNNNKNQCKPAWNFDLDTAILISLWHCWLTKNMHIKTTHFGKRTVQRCCWLLYFNLYRRVIV